MQRATVRCRSASYILVLIIYALPTLSIADEFVVTSHPSILRLSHNQPVENSPGARIGAIITCSRVHIRRLSKIHNINKFFHALKLTSSVSQGDGLFRIQTIEFCLHRNASLGICMCSSGLWRKVPIKGSFVKSLSPFEDWFLDVRLLPDPSRIVEITTDLEFLPHRMVFLVLGFCMMIMAHFLSQSITFYYGGAMTIGIILVVLIVLYQGMKLLPTGRKSSLALVMYSSIVGVAASLLHHISSFLRAALVEIGIYEDMHKPLGILLLACFILAGSWFGYWGVRKLVLTDEGLIDTDIAYFVEWAVLIFGSIMILQSSLDTSLTAQALIIAIVASAASRTHGKLKLLRRFFRMIFKCVYTIFTTMQFLIPFERTRQFHKFRSASPTRTMNRRREAQNNSTNSVTRRKPNDGDDYYSTFHRTPERKMFKKEEWEAFTAAETSKALRDLASSPDFNRWVADNIKNMNLTPPSATATDAGRAKRNRLFGWWL